MTRCHSIAHLQLLSLILVCAVAFPLTKPMAALGWWSRLPLMATAQLPSWWTRVLPSVSSRNLEAGARLSGMARSSSLGLLSWISGHVSHTKTYPILLLRREGTDSLVRRWALSKGGDVGRACPEHPTPRREAARHAGVWPG